MSSDPKQLPEEIKAMAYLEKGGQAQPHSYKPKPMGKHDVDFVVTYNGVCGTDKHMVYDDWGMSRYPLIPGHEVVGHVINVGSEVKDIAVGDVVGLGAQAQQCGECEWCNKGRGNLCPKMAFTYFGNIKDETGEHPHHGGYSSFLRTDGRLVFKIPKEIEEKHAGPIMCAGLTVSTPLFEWANGTEAKGKRVGIVGIGGLGHLAIQYAAKMGAETVALSRSDKKKSFATELGASEYLDTSDEEAMKKMAKSLDMLLVCISGGEFDVEQYAPLMRPYGVIHFCGVPEEPLKFSVQPLMFSRLTISSAPIGSSEQMKTCLEFTAKHGIKPIIEEFPHSKANDAMAKIKDGSIRFRAVLKNDLI